MNSFCIIADIRGSSLDFERLREMASAFPKAPDSAVGACLERGVGMLCSAPPTSELRDTQPYSKSTSNGELYIAIEHSDLETLVSKEDLSDTYRTLGYETPRELWGHFALAVFDRAKRELLLATDPLGAKPLFLHRDGAKIVVSTSIKALFRYSPACAEVDKAALLELLRAPEGEVGTDDVYKNISELKGGRFMIFSGLGAQIFEYTAKHRCPPSQKSATVPTPLFTQRSADLKRCAEQMTLALDIPAFDVYTPEYISAIESAARSGSDASIAIKRQPLSKPYTYRKLYALGGSLGVSVHLTEAENDLNFKRSFLVEREKRLAAIVKDILSDEQSQIKRLFGGSLETLVSKESDLTERIAVSGKIIGLERWLESYPIIPI